MYLYMGEKEDKCFIHISDSCKMGQGKPPEKPVDHPLLYHVQDSTVFKFGIYRKDLTK